MAEFLNHPLGKLLISLALLPVLGVVVTRFFRPTWAQLEAEGLARRQTLGKLDARVPVTLVLGAFCLLLVNYFGEYAFFSRTILPGLERLSTRFPDLIQPWRYADLYWRVYWGLSRHTFYLLPLVVWPLVFRESPLDLGLRTRGFVAHAWIYLLCLVVVIPVLLLAAYTTDFGTHYPMYHDAKRSWLDLWVWEAVYVGQFFTLEVFFRGFWLHGTRSLGAGAIFGMIPPYVMIHFPKPYLETSGAIVAGVVLGSLAMRTRSIWAGFLVHSTVAILMDFIALHRRGALPVQLAPGSHVRLAFPYALHVLCAVWVGAVLGLALLLWRRRRAGATVNSLAA
jgi:membrane protease YdiL (CAAX protease family)